MASASAFGRRTTLPLLKHLCRCRAAATHPRLSAFVTGSEQHLIPRQLYRATHEQGRRSPLLLQMNRPSLRTDAAKLYGMNLRADARGSRHSSETGRITMHILFFPFYLIAAAMVSNYIRSPRPIR